MLNLCRTRPRHPLRHQKAFHSCSDDLPPSTSEDNSECKSVAMPKLSSGDQTRAPCRSIGTSLDHTLPITSHPERFAMTHLVRSDSQTSIESSCQEIVREKEEKWRQRHQNSVKRKVRIQTLI